MFSYEVVRDHPHDQRAFTQGLVFDGGVLFVGTGLYGRSTLRETELEIVRILQIRKLLPQFFGQGIEVFGDRVGCYVC